MVYGLDRHLNFLAQTQEFFFIKQQLQDFTLEFVLWNLKLGLQDMATLDEIRPQRVDMAAVMGAPCPAGTDEPQGILAQKDVSDIAFDSFIDDDDERHDSPLLLLSKTVYRFFDRNNDARKNKFGCEV